MSDICGNAELVKALIDDPDHFSKPLGVSLNFSDPALIVRVLGTLRPEAGALVRPILDGSAKIIGLKKRLL